jgi:hypothetical protein
MLKNTVLSALFHWEFKNTPHCIFITQIEKQYANKKWPSFDGHF